MMIESLPCQQARVTGEYHYCKFLVYPRLRQPDSACVWYKNAFYHEPQNASDRAGKRTSTRHVRARLLEEVVGCPARDHGLAGSRAGVELEAEEVD